MELGWIKLHRKLLDNVFLRQDDTAYIVFTKLLMIVDKRTGSWSGGRKQLAYLVNQKENTLYKTLKRLQKNGLISIDSNNRFSTFSICNWVTYQSTGEQPGNNKVTTKEQPGNTLTRSKKKKENTNTSSSIKDSDLLDVLNRVTNRKFKVLPRSAAKTKKIFTLDQIETALGMLVAHDWHAERLNDLSSDYLLRDTTLDKFLSSNSGAPQDLSKLEIGV